MSIVLQGSTSGSITLQEPAVAGNTVLDLPATSGTLITTGSTGQVIPKAALPTGSVLQVVQAETTTSTSSTSSTFVTSGLSASITPTSSSSKILVIVSAAGFIDSVGNSGFFTLFRGTVSGTNLGDANNGFIELYGSGSTIAGSVHIGYLDSPNTTSSQTYTLGMRRAAGTVTINPNNNKSTITLMEIAA